MNRFLSFVWLLTAASVSAAEPMTMRMYPASPALLQEIGHHAYGQTNDLRVAFQNMGLSWPDGSSIHYRADIRKLIVSDTKEHFDEFEAVLGGLCTAVVSNKLKTIVLPEVSIQRLSIADTIALLITESKTHDPDKEGVLILGPAQPAPKDTPPITLKMRNVPLGQIIEFCAQIAELSADVKGGAVVFQYKTQSTSDK